MKFAIEKPVDGAIPFLDMKVINDNGHLSSTWYSKPTDTGLIMNFHSLAPRRYKHSVVSGFVHRIHRACSTWHHFHDSLAKAKHILEINQYPTFFYEPIMYRTLENIINPDSMPKKSENMLDEIKKNFKMFIQYRGKSTEHYAQALRKLGNDTQENKNCVTFTKTPEGNRTAKWCRLPNQMSTLSSVLCWTNSPTFPDPHRRTRISGPSERTFHYMW